MKTKTIKNIFVVAMFSVMLLFSALLFPIKAQNVVRAESDPLFTGDDLSGTTWELNSEITSGFGGIVLSDNEQGATYGDFSFTCGDVEYSWLEFWDRDMDREDLNGQNAGGIEYRRFDVELDDYVSDRVYYSTTGWVSQDYRTITITDGWSDYWNSNYLSFDVLKAWLNANAQWTNAPGQGSDPEPTPATGVVTDFVMPTVFVLMSGFVATLFVLQSKKSKQF